MATNFGEWVTELRGPMSLERFANKISEALKEPYSKDKLWKLESGSPRNPDADLVMTIARLCGRTNEEALGYLGYELGRRSDAEIDRVAAVMQSLSPTARLLVEQFALQAEIIANPFIARASEEQYDGEPQRTVSKKNNKAPSGGQPFSGLAGRETEPSSK